VPIRALVEGRRSAELLVSITSMKVDATKEDIDPLANYYGAGNEVSDERLDELLRAQVGRPVVFPGAFAVSGINSTNQSARQSDLWSISTAEENDMDDQEESAIATANSEALFQAILAVEKVVVEGAIVIDHQENPAPKAVQHHRFKRIGILLFSAVAISLVIITGVWRGFSDREKPVQLGISGWRAVGV